MSDVVFRLHLCHILSFLGLTTDLSAVAPTCRYWARTVSQLFEKHDVILDCFSSETKYFDFRLQKWFQVPVAFGHTTEHPLAVLVIDSVVTVIDTCHLLIKQFDPKSKSWLEMPKPPTGQEHPPMLDQFACAYYQGYIYLVGGHHIADDSPSSAVWSYNTRTQAWVRCASLPTPFVVCSCAVLLDSNDRPCLTVIGSNVNLINEAYYKAISDIMLEDDWQTIAPAPDFIMRLSSRLVPISQRSLIIGMWVRPHKFTLIEFNLSKNAWGDPFPFPANYYIFPATLNSQIVAMAVDFTNRYFKMVAIIYHTWTEDFPVW